MTTTEDYSKYAAGSEELVNQLVQDHMGWATSIAKSVARAWNMDWQLDGLDGGAFEALLFCARRFDPARGVPFRGYARRRIHEASTQEARNSKTWQRGTGAKDEVEREARELSSKLFDLFPELREGLLPAGGDEETVGTMRSSIRQLLAGASMVAAFSNAGTDNPEIAMEFKQLITVLGELEPVHQEIIWAIYYKGQSMRALAEEWQIDDLSVIREHKVILNHLSEVMERGRKAAKISLKIRRGLRPIAQKLRKQNEKGVFSKFVESSFIAPSVFGFVVAQLILSEQQFFSEKLVRLAEFILS